MAGPLDYELATPEDFVSGANETHYSTLHTMGASLASGAISPFVATQEIEGALGFVPRERVDAADDFLKFLNRQSQNPDDGWGQWGADFASNMVGMALNPINVALGEAGGMAAESAIGIVPRVTPSAIKTFAGKPLSEILGSGLPGFVGKQSLSNLGEKGAIGFGTMFGAFLPQSIADSYDKNTGHIDALGAVKEDASNAGFGLLLGATPFAAGVIWGKARGLLKEGDFDVPLPGKATDRQIQMLEKAHSDGKISTDELNWFKDYKEDPMHPSMTDRAADIVAKGGHPVDAASGNVQLNMFSEDDFNNIKAASADALVSDIPQEHKMLLQNFILNKSLDDINTRLTNNPEFVSGLKGYLKYLEDKLDNQSKELSSIKQIAQRYLKENIRKNDPLSQNSLYKEIKKNGENIPFVVPSNVSKRLRQESELKDLKKRINGYQNKYDKTGNEKFLKLKTNAEKLHQEKEDRLEPLKSPKEEVSHIEDKLIKDGRLKDNYRSSMEFNRLIDLAPASSTARGLLYRIHMMDEYRRQEGFKSMIDSLIKIKESPSEKLAKMDDVKEYLKSRIESTLEKMESDELRNLKEKAKSMDKVPENIDQRINENEQTVLQEGSKTTQKEFKEIKNKMNEFNKSKNVFKDLISCVRGALLGSH